MKKSKKKKPAKKKPAKRTRRISREQLDEIFTRSRDDALAYSLGRIFLEIVRATPDVAAPVPPKVKLV